MKDEEGDWEKTNRRRGKGGGGLRRVEKRNSGRLKLKRIDFD